ncbi:MAG TPA: MATE family efflux transporter [Gammaproteobacteria bacterium]|nr:MATE family efflux transporter [Gammaproteobacteria bacterium]
MNKNIDFFEAIKKIVALALPMTGSQIINVTSGFLCMAMLAALGHDVLAASALIFSTQLSIMVSGMSVLFSISVLTGHAYGAKDYLTIGNYVQQGWTLALLISLPVMLLFWNIDTVLLFFGQSKEIASIVHSYFHAFVWAVIPGFLSTCNMQFGYGIHKKTLIVSTSIMSVVVLLVTAYVLIFGKFGFPKLGVAGLGYATVAQYSFFFVFTTLFFFYEKSFSRFELFRYRVHQHLDHFAKMFKMGWPISVQMGGEMLSFFVSGIMIGWIGTVALASFQIVNQYYFLIVIPVFSLSQASGILIGQACGAKQFHEVKKISHASIAMALMMSLLVAIVFLAFPKSLAAFYMNVNDPGNAATLHLTVLVFLIIAFSQIFDSVRNVLIGILRGLFDTRFPMVMSLLTIWGISMPLSWLLAFPLHYGAPGFVIGGMTGMFAGMLIMIYRWHKLSKKYHDEK